MARTRTLDAGMVLAQRWLAGLMDMPLAPPSVGIECRKQGWGRLQVGRGFEANCLKLGGREYRQGLGSHADSEIVLRCGAALQRLEALVGVDENPVTQSFLGQKLRIVFSVEVAGKELWGSGAMNVQSGGVTVDVALPGITREVVLKATAVDGNLSAAHADWAALRVTTAGRVETVGRSAIECLPPPVPGPFSFVHAGTPSAEILSRWPRRIAAATGGRGFSIRTITWRDPASALECRLFLKAYAQYPALEWVVHFKNTGNQDSEIIEDFQALDVSWPVEEPGRGDAGAPAQLWRSRGSQCQMRDFEYLEEKLFPGTRVAMSAGGGRSSNQWLPFFNLYTAGLGILTAIGWTGQWACTLASDPAAGLRVRAGIENIHLRLHPGEEIRGPRILQLFWTGDRIDAHNQWRRLLMDHYVPRHRGKPVTAPLTMGHWGGMKTPDHLERIAVYRKQRLPHEYYWVDAGWYGRNSSYCPDEFVGDWGQHTGDWRVNPKAHPDGLGPISDAARKAGMKFLLWVEPERAVAGTYWPRQHAEWFLSCPSGGTNLLLNLGDPAARKGATDLIAGLIREYRIGLYRQDFNFEPLPYWRQNDPPDRQGISEIRHITGLYAFWDALLQKFPGLIIDNCASGGRRIDLETISRSIPLWRSDWQCFPDNDPVGGQTHGLGLSYWVPLHGSGTYNSTPTRKHCSTYRARSTMGPAWNLGAFPYQTTPVDPQYPWDWHRRMARDYLRARAAFSGDYYPLTEAKPDYAQWAAYQMDQPALGEGFLMAFRRHDAPWTAARFKLRGLERGAVYQVQDADTGRTRRVKGQDLLEQGLPIQLPHPDTSALVFYRKKRR